MLIFISLYPLRLAVFGNMWFERNGRLTFLPLNTRFFIDFSKGMRGASRAERHACPQSHKTVKDASDLPLAK
jgi:hypothetical protein